MEVPVDLGIAWIEGKIEASLTVGEYSNVHYWWLVRDGATELQTYSSSSR